MKAAFIILIVLIFSIVVFWAKLLHSIRPLLPVNSENIADLLEKSPSPSENTTEFPLTIPAGFTIGIFARDLPGARDIEETPNGHFLVSLTGEGRVVGLMDTNDDGKADRTVNTASKLNRPHGLSVLCKESCKLYIAENNRVTVSDLNIDTLQISNTKKIVDLPTGGGHFTRSLLIKGETLYISVGSSCNVCNESDERRAAILSSGLNGENIKIAARGLRNSVFMALHPGTAEIWATDMGRDLLGDNIPPDEVNIIKDGNNYGWPNCYGKNIHDVSFDKNTYIRTPCSEPLEMPSTIDIPAHSAPLGIAFGVNWPKEYKNNVFVAYHGSWNRSTPTGYKVVRFISDGNNYKQEDFITGWLKDGQALGRPVDLLMSRDGDMLITDDKAGVIYLVSPL